MTASGSNAYLYTPTGNLRKRTVGSQITAFAYDAENRLVKVCTDLNSSSTCDSGEPVLATFTYDGDGKQVKSVVGSTTTYYVGSYFQTDNGVVTKYYFAGAQRIAIRSNGTLYYLLSDHLGSTSITTDASGNKVAELRYKPWGETRFTSGTTPTSYKFTGQREEASIGLYFYNARWYDGSTGRFMQSDSVVPSGAMALDRYAYAGNSPVVYIDPSGHVSCIGKNWDDGPQCFGKTISEKLSHLSIAVDEDMPLEYTIAIVAAGIDDGGHWAESAGGRAEDTFNKAHGGITIEYDPNCLACRSQAAQAACGGRTSGSAGGINCKPGGAVTDNAHHITIASMSNHPDARVLNMVHEFGHTFNNLNHKAPEIELGKEPYADIVRNRSRILRPNDGGYLLYQQDTIQSPTETFADLYVAQIYNV